MKNLPDILNTAINNNRVSRAEADLIQEHLAEIQSLKGTREATMTNRGKELVMAARFIHEAGGTLETCTTPQALAAVSKIRAQDYTLNTSRMVLASLKRFLTWRIENGSDRLNPKKIKLIKVPAMNFHAKTREDLLTREEVERVLQACVHNRDRAIVATIYDGSNRAVDLRELVWKDVEFDENGVRIFTAAKTGEERWIRLTYAVPHFLRWEWDYRAMLGDPRPEDPVFVTLDKEHRKLSPYTIYAMMTTLRRRTGIEKLKPSLFRPSKITHDIEDGYDPAYVMMKNFGHLRTKMLDVYAKPGRDYVDRVALEKAGIKPAMKPQERPLKPLQCPECRTLNPSAARHCMHCGLGLDEEAIRRHKFLLDIARDPEKMKRYYDWVADSSRR